MIKKLVVAVAVLLVVGIGIAAWRMTSKEGFVVEVPESQIQTQLDSRFPLEKSQLLLKVVLSDPKVQLHKDTERVHFEAAVAASVATRTWPVGTAEISGTIDYEPEAGQFYLVDTKIEAMELAGLPAEYQGKVREAANLVVGQALNRLPIYTLDQEDRAQSLAKTFLRSVEVGDRRLRIRVGVR
jgi:hypothetical protein